MPGAEHVISFHIVTEGSCWAETDRRPVSRRFVSGRARWSSSRSGDANIMASAPGCAASPTLRAYHPRRTDRQLPFSLQMNGESGADICRFVCGFLGCDARPFNPLLAALPRIVHAAGVGARAGAGWPAWSTSAVKESAQRAAPGARRCWPSSRS